VALKNYLSTPLVQRQVARSTMAERPRELGNFKGVGQFGVNL